MGKTYEKYMTSQRRVKALEEELAYYKPPEIVVPIKYILFLSMKQELKDLGLEYQCLSKYVPDTWVPYTTKAVMDTIVPYLTFPADLYVTQGADCDDYAKWGAGRASKDFKLGHGVCECWGQMPLGPHGFCLTKTTEGYYIWEPNAGFEYAGVLFKFGEHEYSPQSWR